MPTFYFPPDLIKEPALQTAPFNGPGAPPAFDAWFVHPAQIRQTSVWLFVHGQTFYSFILKNAAGAGPREVLGRFREELGRTLFDQEFSPDEINRALQSLEGEFVLEGKIGKGMKRSLEVLAEHYRWFSEAEGFHAGDIQTVSLLVNETPLEMIGHELPCDELRRLLVNFPQERGKAA